MKINKLKQRLSKNRIMTPVTLSMPEDIVEDLQRLAPRLGFANVEALIRAYVGQGLRADLERLGDEQEIAKLIESLRRQGIKDELIATAVAESKQQQSA
jgi:Arc/MetJ-type ribon-helix-helix transcriptional regulator